MELLPSPLLSATRASPKRISSSDFTDRPMIQTIKNAPTSRPILELFVVDIRSLALLRIGLALATLIYLFKLLPDIELFLSDDGLLPISLSQGLSSATNNWDWSLYWLNGSVWFNRALVTTHIIVALLLLFGFQTRMMTFFCLVMTWSLSVRNPFIVDPGQLLLRMTLLWSVFLPLGAVWSIDARIWKNLRSKIHWRIVNIATAALMIQVVIGYFVFSVSMGLFRLNLAEILAMSGQPSSLVSWLDSHPDASIAISRFLCVISIVGPLTMFIPRFSEFFRGFWIAIHWLIHLGIWFALDESCYSWVAIVSTLVFIPSSFWNLQYKPSYFRDESTEHFNRPSTFLSACRRYLCSFLIIVILLASSIQWQLIDLGKALNDNVLHLSQLTMTALPKDATIAFQALATKGTVRPSFKYEGELADGKHINLLNEFESTSGKLAKRAIVVFPGVRWTRFHLMLWKSSAPGYAKNAVADRLLDWAILEWRSNAPRRASELKTARLDCYEQRLVDGAAEQPVTVSTWSKQELDEDSHAPSSVNSNSFGRVEE
jgi:hypothetical protein